MFASKIKISNLVNLISINKQLRIHMLQSERVWGDMRNVDKLLAEKPEGNS
jgi:hypothetical protein